jgi:Haloacid dehalogenase-like hydrolase
MDGPMAIVTSASRKTADPHLTLAGIRTRFETVLKRDDVARAKPSSDLYLVAPALLRVPPQACIGMEDSNPGTAAAHAAGAIPVMVPDILAPTAETRVKCAAVLPGLHAVLDLLRDGVFVFTDIYEPASAGRVAVKPRERSVGDVLRAGSSYRGGWRQFPAYREGPLNGSRTQKTSRSIFRIGSLRWRLQGR